MSSRFPGSKAGSSYPEPVSTRDAFTLGYYLLFSAGIIVGTAFGAPFWVTIIVGSSLGLLLLLLAVLSPAPTTVPAQTLTQTTPGSNPGSVRARVNPGSMSSV